MIRHDRATIRAQRERWIKRREYTANTAFYQYVMPHTGMFSKHSFSCDRHVMCEPERYRDKRSKEKLWAKKEIEQYY